VEGGRFFAAMKPPLESNWICAIASLACLVEVAGAYSRARDEGALLGFDDPPEARSEGGNLPSGYIKDRQRVTWTGESKAGVTVEVVIAFLWIGMVASMPLITVKYEGGNITKTQITVFIIMWVAFLGGIFLFTNVVAFNSIHFTKVRSLTIIECVYLMSQILTTVGYGDITPANQEGQVFVGFFVLLSLLIIANVLSDVSEIVSKHTQVYYEKLEQLTTTNEASNEAPTDTLAVPPHKQASNQWTTQVAIAPPLPWGTIGRTGLGYLFWVLVGVAFFTSYPGENKTVFQGIYMSIITLSTVGFGAFTPVTEGGMVFGAFWMLFGSISLVALIGAFTELMTTAKIRERWAKGRIQEHEFLRGLPERVDLLSFIKLGLMHASLVEKRDLDMIEKTFHELGPGADGHISGDAAHRLLDLHNRSP